MLLTQDVSQHTHYTSWDTDLFLEEVQTRWAACAAADMFCRSYRVSWIMRTQNTPLPASCNCLSADRHVSIHSFTHMDIDTHTHAHTAVNEYTKCFSCSTIVREVNLSPLHQQSHDISNQTRVCFRWDINSTSSLMPLLSFLLYADDKSNTQLFLIFHYNNGHGDIYCLNEFPGNDCCWEHKVKWHEKGYYSHKQIYLNRFQLWT